MSRIVQLQIVLPDDLPRLQLPDGVSDRLQKLLDRQDSGELLTSAERKEAEGLVDLSDFLSLLRLRAMRLGPAEVQ